MENFRPESVIGEKEDGGLLVYKRGQTIPYAHRWRFGVTAMTTIGARSQILAATISVTPSIDQRRFTLMNKKMDSKELERGRFGKDLKGSH